MGEYILCVTGTEFCFVKCVCLIDESDDDGVHNTGADLSLVKY